MKFNFKPFLSEAISSSYETFETRRQMLIPAMLFSTVFFVLHYSLVIIPIYGMDSIEFQVDFFGGGFVPLGFILSIVLTKKLQSNKLLLFPSLGAYIAGMVFLTHEELYYSKNFLWIYAQVIAIIYASFLCSLGSNLFLAALNLFTPLILSQFYRHFSVYDVLDRHAVIYFATIITLYLSYRSTLNQISLKKMADKLQQSQEVAKLGSWSFNFLSREIIWSDEMYQIFPSDIKAGPPSLEQHRSTIHPDDLKLWDNTIKKVEEDKRPYLMVFRTFDKEDPGKVLWVSARGQIGYDEKGEPVSLFGTCQDITEQKRLEEQLEEEKLKLQQASKLATLGEMAAGVAHEINNPLSIILGNVEILNRKNITEEKKERLIINSKRSIQKISKIVDGLRKFSRTSNTLEHTSQSVRSLLEECIELTKSKSKICSVPILIEKFDDFQFEVDLIQIEQIIINLIANAIDANESDKSPWVKLTARREAGYAVITVMDSGRGIESKFLEKLFNPFFTTKSIGQGTRLGLSISKGIATSHFGDLEYELIDGHTNFILTLPIKAHKGSA